MPRDPGIPICNAVASRIIKGSAQPRGHMRYWLLKSEPATWSWQDQVAAGTDCWDGVRNHQAANNLKAMEPGDRAFFYHSQKGKEIVGIVEVARSYYPDPSDASGRFGMVDVTALKPMTRPVSLQTIKDDPILAEMALVRQSRLSVMPVTQDQWRRICGLGETDPD